MPAWLTSEIISLLSRGLLLTVALTLITSLLSISIGIFIGALRLFDRRWITVPATIYVEIFRNIPALVLIIIFAFALPNILPYHLRQAIFFNNGLMNWVSLATGLSIPWYGRAHQEVREVY